MVSENVVRFSLSVSNCVDYAGCPIRYPTCRSVSCSFFFFFFFFLFFSKPEIVHLFYNYFLQYKRKKEKKKNKKKDLVKILADSCGNNVLLVLMSLFTKGCIV